MSGAPGNGGVVLSQHPRHGDEAPAGAPGAGENLCGHCTGNGRPPDGPMREACNGTGMVPSEADGARG